MTKWRRRWSGLAGWGSRQQEEPGRPGQPGEHGQVPKPAVLWGAGSRKFMIHPGCSRVLPTRSPEHKTGTQQWPGPGPRLPAQKAAGQPWRLGALGSWQEQEVEQGGPGSPSPCPSQHMGTGFLPGCVTLSRVTALPGLGRDPSSWAQGRRLLAPGLSHPEPGAVPPLCAGASGGPEKQQHPSLDNKHARPEGH